MSDGAIDNDYDDAAQSAREQLLADRPDQTAVVPGGIAFDLVTRQPLFVRRQVANDLVEYYEREGFDLLNYKTHPYLPVRAEDNVFECVFLSEITAEGLHDWDSSNTYDYPAGRLAPVPVHEAWSDDDE